MAKISTYPNDTNVTLSDRLIGTDNENNNETKNFTIGSLATLILSQLEATLVLSGQSTIAQVPSALDTPLQVSFGAAQGSPSTAVEIDALGNITFNQAGMYILNAYGSVERQGSSGGTAILLFRGLLNGTQVTSTKAFHIATTNDAIPYEVTVPFQVEAGDVFAFEIMRDSSGVNFGGVYPHTVLGGWSNVPSAEVQIWKIS